MNVYRKLLEVQEKLKAPKNQRNSFGNYNYRSTEDILEALKPLLKEVEAIVNMSDEIEVVGDRYYVKATARFIDIEKGAAIESTAYAREALKKKGMDEAQITGSASSYARKYALNGLFAIDDTKDSDFTNTHGQDQGNGQLTEKQLKRLYAIAYSKNIDVNTVKAHIYKRYKKKPEQMTRKEYDTVCKGYEDMD